MHVFHTGSSELPPQLYICPYSKKPNPTLHLHNTVASSWHEATLQVPVPSQVLFGTL